jgi:DNA-3-methyladenine glycosylase II
MFIREAIIPVRRPFDFGLSLEFLRGFGPTAGEQRIGRDTLTKSWIICGQPFTATMRQRPMGLACRIESPRAIDPKSEQALYARVAAFTSAEDDLEGFYAIAERDSAFAPVAERLRGLHHPKFATPFEAACWGVINQRIQMAQARATKAAIIARWGARGCDAFPEAATLAKAKLAELQATLGNERKARAVWAVSRAFSKVDERFLREGPLSEVDAWLHAIHGVGDFTAAFVLYRGLGRAIALPWGPKFVTAARQTYPTATRATLEKQATAYGPWMGLWSLYLWAATFVRTITDR